MEDRLFNLSSLFERVKKLWEFIRLSEILMKEFLLFSLR